MDQVDHQNASTQPGTVTTSAMVQPVAVTTAHDPHEQVLDRLQSLDLVLICGVVQLFGVVLSVIYSGDVYDIWDILIAGFVLSIYRKFKALFNRDHQSLLVSQLGVSIAYMIIIMTFSELLWPILAGYAVIYGIISVGSVKSINNVITHPQWSGIIEVLTVLIIFYSFVRYKFRIRLELR
jgi:hypothetical protein